jgi:outer membrane protein OmpA-like peptidoglycan-associated protein
MGQGENSPRATNATEEGRRLNRRVEIVVEPIVAETQG